MTGIATRNRPNRSRGCVTTMPERFRSGSRRTPSILHGGTVIRTFDSSQSFIFPRPQAGGDRRDFRPLASDSGWKIPRDWPTILARSPLKDSIVAIPRPRALDQALRTGHPERAEQLVRRLVSAG